MAALHLTFDDGPSPAWTPVVLAALERIGARATFFVLGDAVRAHPDLVRAAVAHGHRVELHADRHERHDRMSAAAIRADAGAALDALRAAGVAPAWWRTPWGRITDATRTVAAERGLRLVGWDADTHDWRGDRAEAMLAAVERDAPAGGVVLAHDGLGPGATRAGCEETVRFVSLAGAWARARGLELEPLPVPEDPAARGVTEERGRADATGRSRSAAIVGAAGGSRRSSAPDPSLAGGRA
ncbi:polysaccharide deacetylase family protein [Patulibacter sp. NPDC049589]|uniref:polysaccharide deacetylase family protein n=1 Tax=Patulibacter sp. NPDC049589 TaxID=3154731 RepID=UPI0034405884